ncbi:MAG: T9SS type A sorting domain-containing protein [Bacteroidetes bacterium]|nr:T9SS type A sorting domain-containing protein [Bacteroidota bacterium]
MMLDRFRRILLFGHIMFIGFNATAQLTMPDSTCIMVSKHYHVYPSQLDSSTYIWKIDGVSQLNSNSNEIDILWETAGTYLLEVQELSTDGCPGLLASGQVFVSQTLALTATVIIQPTYLLPSGIVELSGLPAGNWILNPGAITGSGTSIILPGLAEGTYTYTITNALGCTSSCTFVVAMNDIQLVAINDTIVIPSNLQGSVNLTGNDFMPGFVVDLNTISIISQASHFMTILSNIPGEVIIYPQMGYTGTDSLLYQICCLLPDSSSICSTAWAFITILDPPTAHIIGSTTICPGGNAALVFIFTGQPPFILEYTDGENIYQVAGIVTNTYYTIVQPMTSTDYTIVSISNYAGLMGSFSGIATIFIQSIPHFIVTGGGDFCPNSPGVVIGLSGSTQGIDYQVEINYSPWGAPVAGTDQPLNLGIFNIPGIYRVIATSPLTGCTAMMYGATLVSALPGPVIYTLTGGGECCFGCNSVVVGLSGSQQSVMYHLWLDNVFYQNVPGTGGTLSFGLIWQSGIYTVTATDIYGCTLEMNGYAAVTIHPRPEASLMPGYSTICEGDSSLIWITTTSGTGPFTFTLMADDSIFTVWGDSGNLVPIMMNPCQTTTYTLLFVNDMYCENYGSGSCTINVDSCLPDQVYSISGYIRYFNSLQSPMNNDNVSLKYDNEIIDNVNTDANGYYHFDNLAPGTYSLSCNSFAPFGGINATDALIIVRHFVEIINLTGINLSAADVNTNYYVNSVDALLVAKRFVQMIDTFPAGDWTFEQPSVTIVNENVNVNIKALCYGDVNGSYLPSNSRQPSGVDLSTSGIREVHSTEQFEIPVSTVSQFMPGAISLVLYYPFNLLNFTSVKMEEPDDGTFVYNADDGELRIAWYNINGLNFSSGQIILRIGFTAKNLMNASYDDLTLNLGSESEITNPEGMILTDINLISPKLVPLIPSFNLDIYPNPTTGKTQIVYIIPEEGNVNLKFYDLLGKEVKSLILNKKAAGTGYLTFDANTLPQGIYSCHLIFSGSTQTNTIIKHLVITR